MPKIQKENLENYIDFLLSASLSKCGNTYDAEDLTQETLLSALSYMSKTGEVRDVKSLLLKILSRKFSDMLRKKYRQPTVSIGEDFDIIDEDAYINTDFDKSEAENVRKAVSYLAKIYRDVIVRYYIHAKSVSDISKELGIPEGTVKSRLFIGRDHLKKGLSDMDKYSDIRYTPVILNISYSGRNGINGEPYSLVGGDLIAQNILYAAYEKPLTAYEIASRIDIPAAYIEPIIERLVEGELMKRVGNKIYTDFIIFTLADKEKYISAQKKCVHENFSLFWSAIGDGLDKLRECDFYKRLSFDAKNSLELYFAYNCLDYGIYQTFCEIFDTEQNFKERPNGGRWIAFGNVHFKEFKPLEHLELLSHSYSGERSCSFKNYGDSRLLEMHVYGPEGFPCYMYDTSPDYIFFSKNVTVDAEIAKLLYIIHSKTDPERVYYNTEYLKAIPWLTKCKVLSENDGKPCVNIPVINEEESNILWGLCRETKADIVRDLKTLLTEYYRGKKTEIPSHLDSVPLQKQYMQAGSAFVLATVREAMKRGGLYDGNYDDDSVKVNQIPCPMVLVIE